jgi:hypothetical protein
VTPPATPAAVEKTPWPVWSLVRAALIVLVVVGLLVLEWFHRRVPDPASTVPYSQESQAKLSADHDCTAPRDSIPGLVHYALIRKFMEPKIAWVPLGHEMNPYTRWETGKPEDAGWYVVELCAR